MAVFPELEPNTRSYDFGAFPLTDESNFSAGVVRFKHGDTPQNYQLTLGFVYLTDAEATLIRNHYQSQGGGYRSFPLPPIIWKGHTFSGNIAPYTKLWRYLEAPEEQHSSAGYVNVTIALVSDGINDDALSAPAVDISFTGGAGLSSDAVTTGCSLSVTTSLATGTPFGDVIFAKDFLINKVTTLLHFNGTNGSTTKTDSSYYANTVVDDSPGADSVISTAQSKYGGASLYMDGTTSLIIDNPAINIGATEDHTVEFWFYPTTAVTGNRALCSLRGNDEGTPSINLYVTVNSSGTVRLTLEVCMPIISGAFDRTFAGLSYLWPTANAWNHIAYSRIGTTYYLFINGILVDFVANSYPVTVGRILRIGAGVQIDPGASPALPKVATALSPAFGYMDDLRITKGVARYVPVSNTIGGVFTPPIFQHPDP